MIDDKEKDTLARFLELVENEEPFQRDLLEEQVILIAPIIRKLISENVGLREIANEARTVSDNATGGDHDEYFAALARLRAAMNKLGRTPKENSHE